MLDLEWHKLTDFDNLDAAAFEQSVAKKLGMPEEIQFRYRSTYFNHIFSSDGYAAGYYTYLWAQVLDCDGLRCSRSTAFSILQLLPNSNTCLSRATMRTRWCYTKICWSQTVSKRFAPRQRLEIAS